jgi:hypothetical protein
VLELHDSIDVLVVFLVCSFLASVFVIVINIDVEFLISRARDLRGINALMPSSLTLINICNKLHKLRWLILKLKEVTLVFLDISSGELATLVVIILLRHLFFHQFYAQTESTIYFRLLIVSVFIILGTSSFHYLTTNRIQRLRQLTFILVNEVVVPSLE